MTATDHKTNPTNIFLLTSRTPDHHWENAGGFLLLIPGTPGRFAGAGAVPNDQVGQSRVIEDAGCGVAYVEKDLVESAVGQIAVNQFAQLLGIAERRERTVNQADDLAKMDVGWISSQLVTALGPADALNHAGVFEFEQDKLEEFFRERLFIGDVANLDGALIVVTSQHHHGLQGVESFLRDLHRQVIP